MLESCNTDLEFPLNTVVSLISSCNKDASIHLLHARMEHPLVSKLRHLSCCKSLSLLDFFCETCNKAKTHRLSFKNNVNRSSSPFHFLHIDLWDVYSIVYLNSARYFLNIVDDFS